MAGCSLPLLAQSSLPKASCQKLFAKSSLLPPCRAESAPRGNWSPMRLRTPGSGARDVMLTVSVRALVGWWLQGPFDVPQINWNGLGLAGAPFSSPLLSSPLLSSPLLSSPLLSSPLLSSPLLSSPLLSSPLLSSPLLSSPLLSSPLLSSPLLSSPLLSSPLLSSPLLSSPHPGSGGRAELLGTFQIRSQAHFANPVANLATDGLAASRRVPGRLWQQNRAAGNLSDLAASLLQPCHTESEQSCWQSFGSSGKLIFLILLQPCHRKPELLGKLLHAGPSSLYKSCYKPCHTESGYFLKSSTHALAAESCWEAFKSGAGKVIKYRVLTRKATRVPEAIKNTERLDPPRTKRAIIHYHANTLFKVFQGRPWATTLENCWGVIFDMDPNKGFERFW